MMKPWWNHPANGITTLLQEPPDHHLRSLPWWTTTNHYSNHYQPLVGFESYGSYSSWLYYYVASPLPTTIHHYDPLPSIPNHYHSPSPTTTNNYSPWLKVDNHHQPMLEIINHCRKQYRWWFRMVSNVARHLIPISLETISDHMLGPFFCTSPNWWFPTVGEGGSCHNSWPVFTSLKLQVPFLDH